jgi:hypothetical protein
MALSVPMIVRWLWAKRLIRTFRTSTATNRKMLGMIMAVTPRLRISSEMKRLDGWCRREIAARTP